MKFAFDEATHTYTADDTEVPSVTQIMEANGLSFGFNHNPHAAKFGTAGHEYVRLAIQGEEYDIDEAFLPWHRGIEKFLEEQEPNPTYLEEMIFKMGAMPFAGRFDFLGRIKRFKTPALLDWKFWSSAGKKPLLLAGIQLSGYETLIRDYTGNSGGSLVRAAVHFFEEGYRIHELKSKSDTHIFQSALNLYYFRQRNGFNHPTTQKGDCYGAATTLNP